MRKTGWDPVDTAITTQGDVSYLDSDWMWGGAPYLGVDAQYHENPLENPHEVIFFYNGRTLPSGTLLWQTTNQGLEVSAIVTWQQLGQALAPAVAATAICVSLTQLRRLKKKT